MRFHYKNILSLISLSKTYSFQFAKKTIKNILPEPYLSITPRIDSSKTKETSFSDIQLTIIKYDRKELEKIQKETGLEKPIPCSPVLGPITVVNPKVGKRYRWCTCGMSTEQPFCNGYHEGTNFKPLRFIIEEEWDKLELCGCKFTTSAPFCDKKTCICLRNPQEIEDKEKKNEQN